MAPRKDRRIVHTYCTKNGSCVGSDIDWSVSIPIFKNEQLVIDRQNAEDSTDSAVYG